MRKLNFLPFLLLLGIAITGAFLNYNYSHVQGGPSNPADIAWMLTATALVLLMTPGLSYFYGGMVSSKNIISTKITDNLIPIRVTKDEEKIGLDLSQHEESIHVGF